MTVLGMSWDRFEMVWGSFGDRVGFVLEHFFTVLEQLCDRLGASFGTFLLFLGCFVRDRFVTAFGTVLGAFWDGVGTVVGPFWTALVCLRLRVQNFLRPHSGLLPIARDFLSKS